MGVTKIRMPVINDMGSTAIASCDLRKSVVGFFAPQCESKLHDAYIYICAPWRTGALCVQNLTERQKTNSKSARTQRCPWQWLESEAIKETAGPHPPPNNSQFIQLPQVSILRLRSRKSVANYFFLNIQFYIL